MAHVYDMAVLGATPAGYAAAHYLAGKGADVVVIDAPQAACECPLGDWVPKGFFADRNLPRALARRCKAREFRRVCYHNAGFTAAVEYRARSAAGYFVQAEALVRTLRKDAVKAGARNRTTSTSPAIRLEEDTVHLLGSRQTRARILLVAHQQPADVIAQLAMPMRNIPQSRLVASGLDVPLPKATAPVAAKALGGALHVVEARERTELGMFFLADSTVHVRIISASAASGNRAEELSALLGGLQQAGVLPTDLPLGQARGAVWHPPAGVALELETHVAKRCLLTGTAGGFAESISGQTLQPSVRSALLAADVALAALHARNPQDTLMRYKTSWRHSLANYLRPPNTSLQMLLPLLFVNRRIVSKFTRALLYGEDI